ncbi:MAG: nicotinamide mononucleotide transporter [Francisella endosymbiont of Hyalomma asiaticum]
MGLFAYAIVEVTSIVAFILKVLIYREHWLLCMTIDVLTISIWIDRVIYSFITIAIILVIITKLVALINAIYGYISWRKIYKFQKTS